MTTIDLSHAATLAAWQAHRERATAAREIYMTAVWELQQQAETAIAAARDHYDQHERAAWMHYHQTCRASLAEYHGVVALGDPPPWASTSTPTGPLPSRHPFAVPDLEDHHDHQDHDTERID